MKNKLNTCPYHCWRCRLNFKPYPRMKLFFYTALFFAAVVWFSGFIKS